MAHTIHRIEEELSSRQLMMRAMDYLRGGPLRFSENFGQTVVQNPVPVALIGVGLMMLSRADAQQRRGYQETGGEKAGRLKEKLSHTKEKLSHTAGRAKSAMSQTKDRAHAIGERARDIRSRSGDTMRRSIDTAQRAWNDNPMLVGLCALAGGAILAAALPATRREREVIGPRRDRLVGEAKRAAKSAVETAKSEIETAKIQGGEARPTDEPITSDLGPEPYIPR
jgi:hypothetical protein